MTDQEIFNRVTAHLLAQNKKSEDVEGSCLYRGLDGAMCAVGCIVPDSAYDPSLEGLSVHGMHHPQADWTPRMHHMAGMLGRSGIDTANPATMRLLSSLQKMHDNYPVSTWSMHLRRIAGEYGLSYAD